MNELSTTADSQQQNKCVPTYKNYKGGSVYGSEDDVWIEWHNIVWSGFSTFVHQCPDCICTLQELMAEL